MVATQTETNQIQRALVWSVEPARGDLYVVSFDSHDVLVQLLDDGIADHPEDILGEEFDILLDANGKVIALPIEGCRGWSRCRRLRD